MVVVKRNFPDLVAHAEQIVVGTAIAIQDVEDQSGVPSTLVTFSDLSVLKGDVGSDLTLRFAGGSSGRYVVEVPDMPTFTLGERAVLFVAGNGRDICPLVGVWQGRFRVRLDASQGTEVVESGEGKSVVGLTGHELRFAEPPGQGEGSGAALPMPLDTFRQLIADELASPQQEPASR